MTHRHRVEHRRSEPLGDRAHHEQIRGLDQRQHVFAEPRQQNPLAEIQVLDLLPERQAQLAFTKDDQVRIRHFTQHERHGVDQILLSLVADQRANIDDHRHAVRQPVLGMQIRRRAMRDLVDVDAVVHHVDPARRNAVLDQDLPDRYGQRITYQTQAPQAADRRFVTIWRAER